MLRNLFASFTWLKAKLLDSCFSSGDGCPSVFKVGLSDAGFALAARWTMRAQMSFRGRFGAPWTAVGFLNGGHLHVYQENEEAQLLNCLVLINAPDFSGCLPEQGKKILLCDAIQNLKVYHD